MPENVSLAQVVSTLLLGYILIDGDFGPNLTLGFVVLNC